MCLCFGSGEPKPYGYTDSDMAGDIVSKMSISGFLMKFYKGAISWQSKL